MNISPPTPPRLNKTRIKQVPAKQRKYYAMRQQQNGDFLTEYRIAP